MLLHTVLDGGSGHMHLSTGLLPTRLIPEQRMQVRAKERKEWEEERDGRRVHMKKEGKKDRERTERM